MEVWEVSITASTVLGLVQDHKRLVTGRTTVKRQKKPISGFRELLAIMVTTAIPIRAQIHIVATSSTILAAGMATEQAPWNGTIVMETTVIGTKGTASSQVALVATLSTRWAASAVNLSTSHTHVATTRSTTCATTAFG